METWPHPRLGDVRDSVAYHYLGNSPAPDSLSIALHQRDAQWRMVQHRVALSTTTPPAALLTAPAAYDSTQAPEDTLRSAPRLVAIAPGVWSLDLDDIDSRTLIVEFADHLAIIEVAVGSANGERIVDAARRQWPNKPVRYGLFSHHHPHYLGGLRALMAEGATIVTTPGNETFVRSLAERPFTLEPDRFARAPRPVNVVTFSDRYELADSTNRLVAINYGARSDHTDEFVVFWLPRQRLLFEAEQGWVSRQGTPRASRRAAGLLTWIREQKLDVDRIAQSWPMRENEGIMSVARLDSLTQRK